MSLSNQIVLKLCYLLKGSRGNLVTMMDALPSFTLTAVALASLLVTVSGCDEPAWTLKRADAGPGAVSFFNNTVTDSFMLVRWTWKDSSAGVWDTRLRVSLNQEGNDTFEPKNGQHFDGLPQAMGNRWRRSLSPTIDASTSFSREEIATLKKLSDELSKIDSDEELETDDDIIEQIISYFKEVFQLFSTGGSLATGGIQISNEKPDD
ncbi:uncharacterized protein LOC126838370 isoform X3 [Adelges cooleyi]|uniref:uncharacterized protein LOC126838370 isoform X3 n=1 Tax=Adelges cooleyi TaxID=133065 RepID=UPI0021802515|nr:uncharacterized protein LOC126838370 isoform X3 [Adelges cooleyi]